VDENFDGSARTARVYMQAFEHRDRLEGKRNPDTDLTLKKARSFVDAFMLCTPFGGKTAEVCRFPARRGALL